ncbi:MAG: polyribonucleotide nucleotidyltransferase [Candidatus Marinimicrobia bacterium]|nr:polyribonucleotide nucleotidyltransferase [Candidatus Neomarinimicrobiota bacterium]
MIHKFEKVIGGKTLSLETGRLARQAHGSAILQYGETVVHVAVVESRDPKPGIDFLPLFVDYREKGFAGGKIPGGFFKRESRPSDREILCARLIDRPVRPLFPDGYRNDVMIIVSVLSSDKENPADILGLIGASASLGLSQIPVSDRVAAVRVGYLDGQYVLNPSFEQIASSALNLVVAGTRDAIVMVEGGANELPEDIVLGALKFASQGIGETLDLIDELVQAAGKPKKEFIGPVSDEALEQAVAARAESEFTDILKIADKADRADAVSNLKATVIEALADEFPDRDEEIKGFIGAIEKNKMRSMVVSEGRRIDGRGTTDIRDITCELGVLPRVHGSAVFTRGETQALVTVTLGTSSDSQVMDSIEWPEYRKKFYLHYNFPSFSVGEARIPRGPGRREIGHGMLAERALTPVMPDEADFPYTVRLVSDILESNGSSSMASVCGGALALMDAGVPIKKPVAGIAMGLINEGGKFAILSDILGTEDHLGDMDFKVAGTRDGITAFQLDSKIGGLPLEILEQAMSQACTGYRSIIDIMSINT